jgi:hypothetical protein
MKTWSFARYASIALGIGLLAGCSAAGTQSSVGGGSVVPSASHVKGDVSHIFALTNAHHAIPEHKGSIAHSWMKHVPAGSQLLYESNIEYGTVDVYDYSTGSMVGQVAGFEYPYGECSDKKGDVFVTDFDTGTTSEIAAGTTTVTQTFTTGGYEIGCSVSKKGDLAVTMFYGDPNQSSGYGGVTVFKKANPSNGTDYPGPAYDWPAGYDKKGNLIVECNYASPCSSASVYYLKKAKGSWKPLTLKGATIGFSSSVENMGKVIGVGDQEPGGAYAFGIYSSKLSGTTLNVTNTTVNTGGSCSSYTDVVQWANLTSKPNGLQYKQTPSATIGANIDCFPSPIDTWAFPAGGPPSSEIMTSGYDYYEGQTLVNV